MSTNNSTPIRPDGRTSGGTLRPLAAELSCLHRADGSANFSCGQTSVLAAVYGPAAPRIASREHPRQACVLVVFRHGNKQQMQNSSVPGGGGGGGAGAGAGGMTASYGARERELERFMEQSLSSCIAIDLYPRTVIEVVVQVLKADGGVVGAAVNAAVAALMDAGVEMRSLPLATTCLAPNIATATPVTHEAVGEIRLDPTAEEEADADRFSVVVIVTDSAEPRGVIASMTSGGALSQAGYLACVDASSKASRAVLEFLRLAVEQKVTREGKTLWQSRS